jgi:hypothetical protein
MTGHPEKCPTCGGDGSRGAMFDANCDAAWAHEHVRPPEEPDYGTCVVDGADDTSLHCSTHDVTFQRGDVPPASCATSRWISPRYLANRLSPKTP